MPSIAMRTSSNSVVSWALEAAQECAAPRLDRHDSLARQVAQRLAHRHSSEPDRFGDRAFGQRRVERNGAVQRAASRSAPSPPCGRSGARPLWTSPDAGRVGRLARRRLRCRPSVRGSSRGRHGPSRSPGAVKNSSGGRGLDDLAAIHEHDPVRDAPGESHLVRDDDHRHAVAREIGHDVEDLLDHLRIERRGRLVEQHDHRIHRERARDRHALLLAAGELRRKLRARGRSARRAPAAPGHAPRPRRACGFSTTIGARQMLSMAREMRIELEALEHHADARAQTRCSSCLVGDPEAVDDDLAPRRTAPARSRT